MIIRTCRTGTWAVASLLAIYGPVPASASAQFRSGWNGTVWDTTTIRRMDLTAHGSVFSDPYNWRPDVSCNGVRTAVNASLSADTYYYATPLPGQTLMGEYFGGHRVLISDQLGSDPISTLREEVGTIIHESQHHAGEYDEGVAERVVSCFMGARERDEEGENGGQGGSAGGGSGVTIQSKTRSPRLPGVWVVVYIPAPRGTATVGSITVLCDYDKDTSWPDCPDMADEN